jgi:hypothetical protein
MLDVLAMTATICCIAALVFGDGLGRAFGALGTSLSVVHWAIWVIETPEAWG